MEQRLSIITLGVENLPAMKAFYEQKFEWQLLTSNDDIAFFKLNGMILGLFGKEALAEDAGVSPEGSGFKSFTLAQNLRSEEEVDQCFADLEAKGIRVVKPPEKIFWGGYSGYVADIEDNLWEIAYNPFMQLDAEGNILGHAPLG